MHRTRRAAWLVLAAGTAALDLWSKGLWRYPILEGDQARLEKVVIEDWLYIETIYNTGGVWSLPIPTWILTVITGLAIPVVLAWIFWPARASRIETACKALILGGAIGNFYDRLMFRGVRDFIKVCFGDAQGWCWPTFNVADIALVVGILLLVVLSFLADLRKKKEGAKAAA